MINDHIGLHWRFLFDQQLLWIDSFVFGTSDFPLSTWLRQQLNIEAKPFVKWAGGKGRVISELRKRFPAGFPKKASTYWEPFVGGGALFFAIADELDHAVLSDKNEELITTYKVIQTKLVELLELLGSHANKHTALGKDYYYHIRAQKPSSPEDIAARFIYLNKTCYNGLYRVNQKGEFNVPIGRYKKPKICNTKLLEAVSEVLQKAEIQAADFRDREAIKPKRGDFVYCDPPYHKAFTDYVPGGFYEPEQHALRIEAGRWSESANVMVSNADTSLIRCILGGAVPLSADFSASGH